MNCVDCEWVKYLTNTNKLLYFWEYVTTEE